jgi:hypothetical protein
VLEFKVHYDDGPVVLRFEHSLLSLSKWESRYKKPFLTDLVKTPTELFQYFQDMLLDDQDPDLINLLSPEKFDRLGMYINEQLTASVVPAAQQKYNSETITSELVYYWFTQLKIPFHPTETWHLSRALMLVQIAGYKSQPAKKRNPKDLMQDYMERNRRQRKLFETDG